MQSCLNLVFVSSRGCGSAAGGSGHESRLVISDFLNTTTYSIHDSTTIIHPRVQCQLYSPRAVISTCIDEPWTMTRMSHSIMLDRSEGCARIRVVSYLLPPKLAAPRPRALSYIVAMGSSNLEVFRCFPVSHHSWRLH